MNERLILQALQTAGIAAVAASSMPTLPIKAVGSVAFTVPLDQKYLEFVYIPNNIQGEFWNEEKTHRGMFRLILHWPNDSAGAYPPIDAIEDIASYFRKDRILRNAGISVKITEKGDFSGPVPSDKETLYPVSVRYSSFNA